jgi:hypothetical protein
MCIYSLFRDLAVALTLFAMKLELVRARVIDGLRVSELENEEDPEEDKISRRFPPDAAIYAALCASSKI